MTRKEELKKKVDEIFQCESFGYDVSREDVVSLLLQVEREVWGKVIAGYLRYKESLVPKPGCEKFPMELLMSFEEWCRIHQQELGS